MNARLTLSPSRSMQTLQSKGDLRFSHDFRMSNDSHSFGIVLALCVRTTHPHTDAIGHHNERDTMKRAHIAGIGLTGLLLLTLTACNNTENLTTSAADTDEERFHEKSFSWSDGAGALAKPSAVTALASKTTTFATGDELKAAVEALVAELDDKAFTDSLWKPVDYACDELDLALWNTYGTIRVGDSTVFDEGIMRARCNDVRVDVEPEPSTLAKVANTNPPGYADDRQYPYKMIGHSWADENRLNVYRTSGAETQFEKHRKKFFVTAWWGTDASRIGVRTYYFNCGSRLQFSKEEQRACIQAKVGTDWDSNDDYVSDRFINTLPDLIIVLQAKPTVAAYPDINFGSSRVYNGIVGMHSVNHAGLIFRSTSSSGMGEANIGTVRQYVTW